MEGLLEYKDFSIYKQTKCSKAKINNPKGLTLRKKELPLNFFDEDFKLMTIRYYSYDLKKVIVPSNKKVWNPSIFMGCANLEEVNIPFGVEVIPACCFWACENLKDVIIPESVTRIDRLAFSGCHSFEHIKIPDSVVYIEKQAFFDCRNLKDITYKGKVYNDPEEFNCMLIYYKLTDNTDNEVWAK